MKKKGIYTFKKQINERGYFANIELEVNNMGNGINTLFPESIDKIWHSYIIFGIKYFFEFYLVHIGHYPQKNFTITIKDLQYMDIDSTNIAIVFTTIKALENALNIATDNIMIDSDSGSLILPHPAQVNIVR